MNLNLEPTPVGRTARSKRAPKRQPAPRLRLRPLPLALATLLLAPAGMQQVLAQAALPTGATVVNGQASITTQGGRITVTNSSNAILNWQSFSIGTGNSVRFEQPGSSSQVLNRVLGNDPSRIFGQLSSNGRVWLLNPNGVLFGPTARVDVAGLVASTLNISDADWQAQRYNLMLRELPPAGADAAVVNQGELRSTMGGRVMLVGGPGGVRNDGLIEAPGGQVVLAAGRSVDLGDSTMPDIAVRVSAPQGQVLNLGRLSAAGGRVDLQGAMINQSGIVRADALAGGAGGAIVLRASDTALVSGQISATSDSQIGGRVLLLGPQVGVLDGARVDVSGARGGGEILVGGGAQGGDTTLPNSRAVYFGAGATLAADATDRGAGGNIVLWSDQATRAYGSLSARGGPNGGDGGSIETSGGWLDARPAAVRTNAPLGRSGRWLLDPNDIQISDAPAVDSNISGNPNFTTSDDSAVLSTQSITLALNAGNNVTVTTASAGSSSQEGNISMSGAHINASPSSPVSLTLTADHDINIFNSLIQSTSAPLSITMNAAKSGIGLIYIDSTSLITRGGNITLGGLPATYCGANSCIPGFAGAIGYEPDGAFPGVTLGGAAVLNAGGGAISITGGSSTGFSGPAYGVEVQAGASLTAADVTVVGRADSNNTTSSIGVKMMGNVSATHSINLDGTWNAQGIGASSQVSSGVYVGGSLHLTPAGSDPSASVSIRGAAVGQASGWDSLSYYGSLLASGQSTVRLLGDNGGLTLNPSTFDTSAAALLSISGSGFLGVSSDMVLPTGGTFSVNTLGGANFSSGTLSGNPTTVSIDVGSAPLWIGAASCGGPCSGPVADLNFGSAAVTMSGGSFEIGNSGMTSSLSARSLTLRAHSVTLGALTTGISASGSGDSLVIAGQPGNAAYFVNNAGSGVLTAPNGRWLVFATDPFDSANFNAGGLAQAFTQYNTVFGAGSAQGAGNGLLFSLAPQATLVTSLYQLAASGATVISKPYDGTTTVTNGLNPASVVLTGLLPGDHLQGGLSISGASYAGKNVGTAIPISLGLSVEPSIVDNAGRPVYGYTFGSNLAGNITPRPITVSGVAFGDKVYDGTRTASVIDASLSGLVGSETLTFQAGTAAFNTKDVGLNKPVTGSITLLDGANGGLASNYTLTGGNSVAGTASIAPRPVTVGDLVVTPKVYDGNTVASVTGGTVSGVVAGETLKVATGAGQFDTKDVGIGKTVTATVTLADGSGLASNYTLSNPVGNGLGDITPRPVTVSGLGADNKVYDGTTVASLHGGSFTGLVGSETLTLARTGVFDTKDVGTGKTVTATVALSDGSNGGKASNYLLSGSSELTATADITPKLLSLSGLSAVTRDYDGTRNVTLAGSGSLSGLVGSEQLGFSLGTGQFDTKDAGVDKTITASMVLTDGAHGGKASNYALPAAGAATFTGTITPKALLVDGVTAADKVYDGNTNAIVSVASVQGFVPGETLVVKPVGQFADKNAGTGKSVSVALTLQDGSGGGLASNYRLGNSPAGVTANIDRRPVTLGGVTALDKVYDGTLVATLGGGNVAGLVAGETLTVGGSAQFADKNVGTGKAVTGSLALSDGAGGGLASNYILTGSSAFSGNASIQPRSLTVTGASAADKVYDTNVTAQVSNFTLAGVLPGEQVTVSAGNGRFADPNVGVSKPVTATATALGGADAGNYSFSVASVLTRATITPATLTYVASPAVRPVGQTPGDLPGAISGFVGSDSVLTATTGVLGFATTANASSPEGLYPVFGAGLSALNYVFTQAPANATALALLNVPAGLTGGVGSQSQRVVEQGLSMLPLPGLSSPGSNRVDDVLQTLVAGSSTGAAFRSIDLSSLSLADTASLLSARDRYKRAIFADALVDLERDPTLADVPSCPTVEQAAAGNCLITEALKPALRERILRQQAPVPPAAAPLPPAAATTGTPAVPAPAAPTVASVRPAPVAEPRITVPARRAVLSAAVPQIERKLALVIGIDHYTDTRIPQLDNAVSDAAAVGEVLEKSLGYQAVVVRDGSKQAILAAFNQLAALVSPSDSVVIYYAGHGELVDKTGLGYWQPASADASRPETWISNSDIGKLLGQLTASQVALISDSCFSGSLVSDERIRGIPVTGDPSVLLSRRAVVVMSSGGNEPVFDSGKNGHSTFAWNLMRTIEKVSTWRPGSAVFEQVRFAVAKELPQRPQYGASRLGGHQTGTDYLFEQRQLDGTAR